VKPLVEISIPHYESLLKYKRNLTSIPQAEKRRKTEENTIAILCDPYEAEMLRAVAKYFCPNAIPQIEKAIRLTQRPT
jgi:hypothetical protein